MILENSSLHNLLPQHQFCVLISAPSEAFIISGKAHRWTKPFYNSIPVRHITTFFKTRSSCLLTASGSQVDTPPQNKVFSWPRFFYLWTDECYPFHTFHSKAKSSLSDISCFHSSALRWPAHKLKQLSHIYYPFLPLSPLLKRTYRSILQLFHSKDPILLFQPTLQYP